MSTITSMFEQAQLAEAAYANLWDNNLNSLITNPEDVVTTGDRPRFNRRAGKHVELAVA